MNAGFTMQKKIVSTIATLALASAGVLYAAPSDAGQAHKPHRKATNFAFKGSGYGTKAKGGQVPAGSDTSAFQAFGCSNMAGSRHENFVAVAQLPGAGQAEEITTKLATTSAGGETASTSKSHVARVVLAENGAGSVEITSITSIAKALYDAHGFDSQVTSTIGGITFTPPSGPDQEIPVPSPGQSVTVPGLATISMGTGTESASGKSASAVADGIRIDMIPSDTSVRIAHTAAKLERGVVSGLMAGNSLGARSTLVGGVAQLGKTPLSVMPCRGTDGQERVKSIASVTPSPGVELRNLTSRQLGSQGSAKSSGTEFGRVGVAEFNDADILVKNVIGQVNVVTSADNTKRDIDGTDVGRVMVQGQEREFPDSDVINVPGVARLERSIVEKTPNGISVIALRVTLFDGQGQVESVLNLGEAALSIKQAK
jgi:hypothetical protein